MEIYLMEKYQFPKIKNEIQFEDFTKDLLNLIHSDTSFQLYGRKGQSQNGLDGYSTFHNIFFQCKHKSSQYVKDTKLEEELVAELDKAKNTILKLSNNTISKFLFFTTHPNTTKLQDKARLLSNDEIIVEYWGWESIESYLNDFYLFEHKDFYKKYYPELATGLNSSIPPQLTIKSSTHDNNFIGREDEVKVIDTMLKDSNSLLLINGIGGIGKSSLANHYLYTREKQFKYYGFIEGLDSFISEFRNSLDLKSEKEEELYREIMFKLQDLKGNKLLVIDNVEDIESHKQLMEMILSLHKYDYKILFTSRRQIKNVTAYPLGTLLLDDARELFLSYCKTDELEKVDEIINYLGLHTLFIKLVAETIENEGYSLDNILEKFENGELSKIEFIDDESGDEVTFNQNLQELFSMQNLKDEYVLLLKRLAVLPSIDIELSFLEEILGKERLKGRLNFLVSRGWLIKNNQNYKLHQIIKEFLLANYAPYFEEIESITNKIAGVMRGNHDSLRAIETIPYLIFFENLEKIFILLNLQNKEVATFFIHYGNIFRVLRIYDKARRYTIQALRIRKRLFGDTRSTSIAYNNLAEIYDSLGLYKKAERLYIKALEITKEQVGERHKDTATSYNNLGDLYREMELYDDSILLHNKALNIRIEIFGENNDYTASSYHNLGLLYRDKKEFNKAEELYFKALNIWEKILEENHPNIATLYKNLAILYGDQQKFQSAYNNMKKAIKILKCIFPSNHSQLLESKNILRVIEEKLGDQKKIVPKKISRNNPCPCKSGKKYKKCCGKPK